MKKYCVLNIYSKELERDVKVYVSLPDSYDKSDKSFPVLYMHDGQILFNDVEDSQGTSWGIMEGYKNNPLLPEVILVGIASCHTRDDELLPVQVDYNNSGRFFGGKANNYLDFIVHQLKPIINQTYRTLTSPKHTGMLGISLGGVCTTYAATKYTKHFSLFAGMSNAYVPIQKDMVKIIKDANITEVNKMYLDVGTKESQKEEESLAYIKTNKEIFNLLVEKLGPEKIKFELFEDAQHIETDWEKRFPNVISYLFKE